MALLTVTPITKAGGPDLVSTLANSASAGGDQVPYASGLLIVVNNEDASSHTATISAPTSTVDCGDFGDVALTDIALVVAAGEVKPVSVPAGYAAGGLISITYDAVTSVSVEVFSIAP